MRKSDREHAYHEAGHAVIARRHGLDVPYVVLLPTDDALAQAPSESATYLARNADRPTQLAAIEKDFTVCIAGPLAQRRHRPSKSEKGWYDDRQHAGSLVARAVLLETGIALPEPGTTAEALLVRPVLNRVPLLRPLPSTARPTLGSAAFAGWG